MGGASQGVRLVGRVGLPQELAAAVGVAGPELAVPGAGEGDAVHALALPLQVPVHLQTKAHQLLSWDMLARPPFWLGMLAMPRALTDWISNAAEMLLCRQAWAFRGWLEKADYPCILQVLHGEAYHYRHVHATACSEYAHLVPALAKEGLLDAALEGVIGGQVDDMELAAVVNVARADEQVVHVRGSLRAASAPQIP